MPKQTREEKVVEYLKGLGLQEIKNRQTKKYRCFVKGKRTFWVGKMGAVRSGRTVGESYSITVMVDRQMKGKSL